MPTTNNTTRSVGKSLSIEGVGIEASNHEPYVRFATTENGFTQERIVPLGTEAPENCLWESPAVYWLNQAEMERLSKGTSSKNVQHSAIKDGRATYRVVAESDRVGEDDVEDVIQWLQDFATDYLGIDNYQLYYSVNRSIHLETDAWVTHEGWQNVKSLTEAFSNETDGQLDSSIYKDLPQFRRSGVEHTKTDMCKVKIAPTDSIEDCFNKATSHTNTPNPHYTARVVDTESLLSEIEGQLITPYIKENPTSEPTALINGSGTPFSPYAGTGNGRRSLAIVSNGGQIVEHEGSQYVFAHIKEAKTPNGYTRYNSADWVKLSGHDARKWDSDYDGIDYVAIIGNRSRNSRIIPIDFDEAELLHDELRENGIDEAIELLGRWGHDTGSTGHVEGNYSREGMGMSREVRETKRKLESGERPINYPDMRAVCCSLLRTQGFDEADAWVQRVVFGSQYDPQATHDKLTALTEGLNRLDDGHPDIAIPTEVQQ